MGLSFSTWSLPKLVDFLVAEGVVDDFLRRACWEGDVATGWRPHDEDSAVLIDPSVRFARPAVGGISTEVIWEDKTYLGHHLQLAGRSDTLFSDDAIALVHQVSRGLPRAVNNRAIQALIAAFASNKSIVDESSARAAVTEVTTE
jgi:hypothetical protein